MSYRFVQAKYFTPGGMVQPRAVVIHMAEGGGTVEWLSGGVTNNNSSHFVVRYTGEIVQMVKDGDASHSLHVDLSGSASDFGTYSPTIAKGVLGADGFANPNAYLYAVEVEGFAANGPNPAQVAALALLIRDLRARHPSLRGNLGHRDFQAYKPCPGGRVPWASIGGHGLYAASVPSVPAGSEMKEIVNPESVQGSVTTNWDCVAIPLKDGDPNVSKGFTAQAICLGYVDGQRCFVTIIGGGKLYAFKTTDVTFTPSATGPAPALDEQAIRKDQRAKDRAEAAAKLLPDT